jgi:hypothetical protein
MWENQGFPEVIYWLEPEEYPHFIGCMDGCTQEVFIPVLLLAQKSKNTAY